MTKKITCPCCAGIDEKGVPINCLICKTNPKYIDKRKLFFDKIGEKEE